MSDSSDIPERAWNRTHTSLSQQLISTDRHTIATSSIRFPSISLDKIPLCVQQNQEPSQIGTKIHKQT